MDQTFKFFENKHYPNLKEYVSQFGNIDLYGHLVPYAGLHPEHWREISSSEFVGVARPEAIVLITFINTHKRLPNYITVPYGYSR